MKILFMILFYKNKYSFKLINLYYHLTRICGFCFPQKGVFLTLWLSAGSLAATLYIGQFLL